MEKGERERRRMRRRKKKRKRRREEVERGKKNRKEREERGGRGEAEVSLTIIVLFLNSSMMHDLPTSCPAPLQRQRPAVYILQPFHCLSFDCILQ